MKKRGQVILLVVLILILLIVLGFIHSFIDRGLLEEKGVGPVGMKQASDEKKNWSLIQIGGKSINVEVVRDAASRSRGLSGRTTLGSEEGMLFVFDTPDTYGFWMKDMNISIDIIWIDEAGKIVHIEKNVSPETYPKIFKPEIKALYVLEVEAGFTQREVVSVGDFVIFPPDSK